MCAAALVVVVVDGGVRPTLDAAVFVGALAALTAWTAVSYFWSESPPLALVEAQRVALYFGVALAVVLMRRWLEPRWLCAGVAGAATLIAVWNLVLHVRGVANAAETGGGAAPIGYANSLALLCVIGALALLALPRPALIALPALIAELVVQSSSGAWAALAAAGIAYLFATRPEARRVLAVVAIVLVAASPFALRGHERTAYWHVAVREAEANPIGGSGAGTFADWWLRERSTPISTKEAHSLYLETLAELGPIGLALVLVVFAVAIAAAFKGGEPALGAAVVAYAVGAGVDFHWELAGATVPALVLGAAAVSAPHARRSSVRALPVLVPLIAATVLACAGNERLASAHAALSSGDDVRAVADARSALRFAPFSAEAWEVIGDATHSPAAYRRGVALDRNDWNLWFQLAAVTGGEPHRLARREAARLNPFGPSEP